MRNLPRLCCGALVAATLAVGGAPIAALVRQPLALHLAHRLTNHPTEPPAALGNEQTLHPAHRRFGP